MMELALISAKVASRRSAGTTATSMSADCRQHHACELRALRAATSRRATYLAERAGLVVKERTHTQDTFHANVSVVALEDGRGGALLTAQRAQEDVRHPQYFRYWQSRVYTVLGRARPCDRRGLRPNHWEGGVGDRRHSEGTKRERLSEYQGEGCSHAACPCR